MAGMLSLLRDWLTAREAKRQRRFEDARELLQLNPRTAYYDAQRLAARSRFRGDGSEFMHWAAVAAEVAKINDNPMDIEVVQAIVDDERANATKQAQ
jgi:hypothetical protein